MGTLARWIDMPSPGAGPRMARLSLPAPPLSLFPPPQPFQVVEVLQRTTSRDDRSRGDDDRGRETRPRRAAGSATTDRARLTASRHDRDERGETARSAAEENEKDQTPGPPFPRGTVEDGNTARAPRHARGRAKNGSAVRAYRRTAAVLCDVESRRGARAFPVRAENVRGRRSDPADGCSFPATRTRRRRTDRPRR